MAIVTVSEDWKSRKTSISLSDGTTGVRVFNVYSDTHDELEATVYQATPVVLGDSFPGTVTCVCTEISADRITDDRTTWIVTASYKSIVSQAEAERITFPNPIDRAAQITFASRTVMTAVTTCLRSEFYRNFRGAETVNGTLYPGIDATEVGLVANSAEDPYDPPLEIPLTQWVVNVSKAVLYVPIWIRDYDNCVNSDLVRIADVEFQPGTLKTEGIRIGSPMKENGFPFVPLQFSVIIGKSRPLRSGGQVDMSQFGSPASVDTVATETVAPDPWDIEVLDEGMRLYVQQKNKWKNIELVNGEVTKPVPLNGAGGVLNPNAERIPEYALWRRIFRPYPRKPFNVLPWV